jgi:LuxR family maltose regulon positive regulatory protein
LPIRTADLLLTKLQRPGITHDLVHRPRLVERLDRGASGPLTLVCAPAGFGKSTLVSSWLEGMAKGRGRVTPSLPCAWLSLDADDSDLIRFLRYLVAALRTIHPGTCAETAALLVAPQLPPLDVVVATLSNEIARLPEPFVLVLEDYYTIQGDVVHELLNGLALHWPQPMHLVLISRLNPPLPLASLRARGQLVEIRTHDLRFTYDETAEYLRRVLEAPPSKRTVDLAEQRTEGWIAGLHLAGLSLRSREEPEALLESLSGAEIDIAGYLADEVFSLQPPVIQRFLLRTSILDRFCTSLCEPIAGSGAPDFDVRACMEWVERADLFVIPLDDRGQWYRYHHLFRDLLQQRLLAEASPDQVKEIHSKASIWFAEQGLTDEALYHALAADDLDLAASLMEQGFCDVLNRTDRPTLDRWLRLLPDEFIQHRPGMLMIKVWALELSWQLDAQWRVMQRVEALIADDRNTTLSGDELRIVRGQLLALHGQAAFFRNDASQAMDFCQEALSLLPSSWTYVRGGAMLYLGLAMHASGQGRAAEHLLLDEYAIHDSETGSYAPRLLMTLCFILHKDGRLEEVGRIAQMLLRQATERKLAILQSWGHYFLGVVHYQQNDLDAARQHFEAVIQSRYLTIALAAVNGFTGLILVRQARGEATEAFQTLDLLSQFDLQSKGAEAERIRSLRARLVLLGGDLAGASRWADSFTAPPPDGPLHWLEEPHLTKARILLTRDGSSNVQSALRILDALYEIARRAFDLSFRIEILALRALAYEMQGKADDALAELQQAVELSQPGRFVRVFADLGPSMQALLLRFARQGFAAESISHILAAFLEPQEGIEIRDAAMKSRAVNAGLVEPLTGRELDVLMLLRERLSNKEIAGRLCLSTLTVKRHLVNIYGKLGVNRRWDAVVKAETLGILPSP